MSVRSGWCYYFCRFRFDHCSVACCCCYFFIFLVSRVSCVSDSFFSFSSLISVNCLYESGLNDRCPSLLFESGNDFNANLFSAAKQKANEENQRNNEERFFEPKSSAENDDDVVCCAQWIKRQQQQQKQQQQKIKMTRGKKKRKIRKENKKMWRSRDKQFEWMENRK